MSNKAIYQILITATGGVIASVASVYVIEWIRKRNNGGA